MLAYVAGVQRKEIREGVACVKHQAMAGSDIGDDHKEYLRRRDRAEGRRRRQHDEPVLRNRRRCYDARLRPGVGPKAAHPRGWAAFSFGGGRCEGGPAVCAQGRRGDPRAEHPGKLYPAYNGSPSFDWKANLERRYHRQVPARAGCDAPQAPAHHPLNGRSARRAGDRRRVVSCRANARPGAYPDRWRTPAGLFKTPAMHSDSGCRGDHGGAY